MSDPTKPGWNKNTFTEDDRKAFRGPLHEGEIHGPAKLYRVTAEGGHPQRGWWVTEEQMAGFINPETKEFDPQRWRSWAAVKSNFQPSADRIHVLELKEGEKINVTTGSTKYQNEHQNEKIAFMGSADQVYIHEVPPVQSYSVGSPECNQMTREVADRHPDRVGQLHPPRQDPDGPPRDPNPPAPKGPSRDPNSPAPMQNRRGNVINMDERRAALDERKSKGAGPQKEGPAQQGPTPQKEGPAQQGPAPQKQGSAPQKQGASQARKPAAAPGRPSKKR